MRGYAIVIKTVQWHFFMKKSYILFSCLGFMAMVQKAFGQSNSASLEKNFNLYASDLSHELNTTKDSLILKAEKPIGYVYSINKDYKREIDAYAGKKEYKVPLKQLSKGKHVFVVSQSGKRIVFVVQINEEMNDVVEISKIEEVTSIHSNQG